MLPERSQQHNSAKTEGAPPGSTDLNQPAGNVGDAPDHGEQLSQPREMAEAKGTPISNASAEISSDAAAASHPICMVDQACNSISDALEASADITPPVHGSAVLHAEQAQRKGDSMEDDAQQHSPRLMDIGYAAPADSEHVDMDADHLGIAGRSECTAQQNSALLAEAAVESTAMPAHTTAEGTAKPSSTEDQQADPISAAADKAAITAADDVMADTQAKHGNDEAQTQADFPSAVCINHQQDTHVAQPVPTRISATPDADAAETSPTIPHGGTALVAPDAPVVAPADPATADMLTAPLASASKQDVENDSPVSAKEQHVANAPGASANKQNAGTLFSGSAAAAVSKDSQHKGIMHLTDPDDHAGKENSPCIAFGAHTNKGSSPSAASGAHTDKGNSPSAASGACTDKQNSPSAASGAHTDSQNSLQNLKEHQAQSAAAAAAAAVAETFGQQPPSARPKPRLRRQPKIDRGEGKTATPATVVLPVAPNTGHEVNI